MEDLIERQIAIDAIKTWGLIDGLSEGQAIEILSDENKVPSAEPEAISKWKKEFREYVDSLDIARDDWKGIIEYIDELPLVQPDTTTHDSIPAEIGKNDADKTSGDFISKQASIDELHGKDPSQIWDTADIEVWLNTLPSIQPERPKGKWIHQAKFSRVECDQCGKVFRNSFAPKNFCPNCGADMRGDKHELWQKQKRVL